VTGECHTHLFEDYSDTGNMTGAMSDVGTQGRSGATKVPGYRPRDAISGLPPNGFPRMGAPRRCDSRPRWSRVSSDIGERSADMPGNRKPLESGGLGILWIGIRVPAGPLSQLASLNSSTRITSTNNHPHRSLGERYVFRSLSGRCGGIFYSEKVKAIPFGGTNLKQQNNRDM
jgi:hypothetical protein